MYIYLYIKQLGLKKKIYKYSRKHHYLINNLKIAYFMFEMGITIMFFHLRNIYLKT